MNNSYNCCKVGIKYSGKAAENIMFAHKYRLYLPGILAFRDFSSFPMMPRINIFLTGTLTLFGGTWTGRGILR